MRSLRKLLLAGLVIAGCGGNDAAVVTDPVKTVAVTMATTTTLPRVEMSLENEAQLERQLVSQNVDEFVLALTPVVATAILSLQYPLYRAALPKGSTLDIDPTTLVATSADTAVVNAVVVGEDSQAWVLFLQKVGDQWLVYGTQKGAAA